MPTPRAATQHLRIGLREGEQEGRGGGRQHGQRYRRGGRRSGRSRCRAASATSDPVRIGVPTRRPNSVSLRPSSSLMRTPMIEKIVHTAKQTVKATVDIASARAGADPGVEAGCDMVIGFAASFCVASGDPGAAAKTKSRPIQAALSQQDRAALPGCPGLGAETC